MSIDDSLPDDVVTLQAMLRSERAARLTAEAEAQARSLLIEKLKLTIKKLRHERFGQSSERGALLAQLELQLADLEENATQAETAAQMAAAEKIVVPSFARRRPARRALPGHLPRERIVYPAPSVCPCCGGGTLRKIGEDVTETLELIPRQWKVIRRWVVERTLAWLNRNRRLAKDFEASVESAVAWLLIASIKLLTRRLARA